MRISIKDLKILLKESILAQQKKYFLICDEKTNKFLSQTEKGYPHFSDKFRDYVRFSDLHKADDYLKNSFRQFPNMSLKICEMDVFIKPI